jgi:hypothetical protein
VKQPVEPAVSHPTTVLGNWYANAIFVKPQLVLLVNERTLFPVVMPLAPAATVMKRFPGSLRDILEARGIPAEFIDSETAAMAEGRYARTNSKSILGVMNDFVYHLKWRHDGRGITDPLWLGLELSQTPSGPLRDRHGSPERELDAVVVEWLRRRVPRESPNGAKHLLPGD